jgi:hypothetical protein
VVYISSADDVGSPGRSYSELGRWRGHVESYQDDQYREVGKSGRGNDCWDTVEEAIVWARERASIVLVRIGNTHYSAGATRAEDDENEPLPVWPPEQWDTEAPAASRVGGQRWRVGASATEIGIAPEIAAERIRQAAEAKTVEELEIELLPDGVRITFAITADSEEDAQTVGHELLRDVGDTFSWSVGASRGWIYS